MIAACGRLASAGVGLFIVKPPTPRRGTAAGTPAASSIDDTTRTIARLSAGNASMIAFACLSFSARTMPTPSVNSVRRVAAHLDAVRARRHPSFALQVLERSAEPVPDVPVLGEDAQRALFPAASDQDLRPALLDGPRHVERALDSIELALERRALLGEHQLRDLHGLIEAIHAARDRRELDPVTHMLVLVPRSADPEDRAPFEMTSRVVTCLTSRAGLR